MTSLNKRWKELLFAASGFGPNLLMVLMMAYFTDAVNPVGLVADKALWSITGSVLVAMPLFSILWTVAKIFDGIVDVPLASLTDNLRTKWGRRRPPIAVSFIPMVVSYALCWIPVSNNANVYTIWILLWALIFFASYTMCLIAFYGSLSTVCVNEQQRIRVSSFKSFFDTISYCLVYAAIPALMKPLGMSVDKMALICLPLMATMIIPLFMIKEGAKYGDVAVETEKKVKFFDSIRLTFTNRMFLKWLLPNCCAFMGLQMFLSAQNTLISGVMGLGTGSAAILNTCAFAPVPIMLYLFNRVKKKKGIRFAYQTSLIGFAICILSFDLAGSYFWGNSVMPKIIIGAIGGIIGSWSIGSFFMMPYLIPTQIAAEEEKLTGKNHAAMYFAAQALTTSIVGALSSGIIYENIKGWTVDGVLDGVAVNWKCGVSLVPVIVSFFCLGGFFLTFLMPKNYTSAAVAKELKKQNKDLVLPEIKEEEPPKAIFDEESLIVNLGLTVLSGTLFGLIWSAVVVKQTRLIKNGKMPTFIEWFLLAIVPFYSVYWLYSRGKMLVEKSAEWNVKVKNCSVLNIVLPFLPLGKYVAFAIMQKNLNAFSAKSLENACKEKECGNIEANTELVNG